MLSTHSLSTGFLLTASCCVAMADSPAPAVDTHQSLAIELVSILSETEIQLRSCTDEHSVVAAIPQLLQLKERATQLKERQKALPEPTVQDFLAAEKLMGDFNTLTQAIESHITRLQQQNLVSPELKTILHL